MKRQGFKTLWKVANVLRVVKGFDMFARAGNGDAIEQFKKIKVE